MSRICEYEIKYKYYYKGDWGFSYQERDFMGPLFDYLGFISDETPTFYTNLSDVLKNKYSRLENSNVEEKHISELNKILKSLSDIDKILWLAIEYTNVKQRVDEHKKSWELESSHRQRVDSLFRN